MFSLTSLNSIKRSLINPKVKPMIDRYIYEMKKYIDGNITNYETPQKIDDFINKKGLNDIFGYYGGASVLTNEVFRDIQEIQNKGGLGGLLQKFKLINNEYHSLQNKINQLKDIYTKEELENENYIKMYGNKWDLPLDPTFKGTLNELLNELNTKRQNDIALSSIIMNDKEFYNLLQFKEKAEIEAKIPKDMNQIKVQSSPLIEQLQKNANILYEKKSTIGNLINGLYTKINNEWPLDDFNQVAKNLKTESSVVQEQKTEMTNDFKEIEKINEEIVNLYPLIEKDYNEYIAGFQAAGTPNYQAPEMNGRDDYNEKVDVYSMGVTFFELCYYTNPKTCDKDYYFEQNIYSKELNDLIRQMLRVDPDDRISSFEAVVIAKKYYIQKFLKNTSVEAVLRCLYIRSDI